MCRRNKSKCHHLSNTFKKRELFVIKGDFFLLIEENTDSMQKFTFILILFFCALNINSQDIIGTWKGDLEIPGNKLPLVFQVSQKGNELMATMDSPAQSTFDVPVAKTYLIDGVVTFDLTNLGITYSGKLKGGIISGKFMQSGIEFPLELNKVEDYKGKEGIIRPQEPSRPFPYQEESVKFKSENDIILAGTLTLPANTDGAPVVILISGSGPQARNEEFMSHKPFLVLADHLTKNGISVLRYDDRGVGESTGNFAGSTSFDFANDVEAAVMFIKSRAEFVNSPIGLIGHSEGGLIAPIVASQKGLVDFIVLMAGPGVPGDQLLLTQQRDLRTLAGESEEVITATVNESEGAFELIKKYGGTDEFNHEIRNYINRQINQLPESEKPSDEKQEEIIQKNLKKLNDPWLQNLIKYDPSEYLRRVDVPVLALNGGRDVQVAAYENLHAIEAALKSGKNPAFTVKLFPEMNHLFQKCETGAMREYAQIENTIDPEVLNFMSEWILKR
jgi:pimeloyl-ACP methyl ester carboxylesterase